MMTIVKMGTNPSGFRLSGGKFINLNVFPAVNDLEDGDFELLMKEYGHFIKERTYRSSRADRSCGRKQG